MRTIVLSMAIGLLAVNLALAGDCCTTAGCCDQTCDKCGCKKVCKVVCEMQKVKRTVWVVECEDFCAPLPNCDSCCDRCKSGCCKGGDACGGKCCNDPCRSLVDRKRVPPKCGKVRTKKTLVKKEIVCEVPVYKCVVVCCDPGCRKAASGCVEEAAPTAAPTEAPAEQVTDVAPMPPLLGTLYTDSRGVGR